MQRHAAVCIIPPQKSSGWTLIFTVNYGIHQEPHRGQFSSVKDLIPGLGNIPRETEAQMLNKGGSVCQVSAPPAALHRPVIMPTGRDAHVRQRYLIFHPAASRYQGLEYKHGRNVRRFVHLIVPQCFLKIESVLSPRRSSTRLIWPCRPPWERVVGSLRPAVVWRRLSSDCWSAPVSLSDHCFHRRRLTRRTPLLAGLGSGVKSSEVKLPTGTGREKGRNEIDGRAGEVGLRPL